MSRQIMNIQTLNNISAIGLEKLPKEQYKIADDFANPDAILVRSAKMTDMSIITEGLLLIG